VIDSDNSDREIDELFSSFQRLSEDCNEISQPKLKKKKHKSKSRKLKIGGLASTQPSNFQSENIEHADVASRNVIGLKTLFLKFRPTVFGIQETKLDSINHQFIRHVWPDSNVGFVASDSIGASVRIVTLWDSNVFTRDFDFVDKNYVGVIGSWAGIHGKIGFLNVYAPQAGPLKEALRSSLESLLAAFNLTWIIFGDFNVVRLPDERLGSRLNIGEANVFNDFIYRCGLFDFPLGGRKFTRFDREGSKASKLDRFLVNQHFFDHWNDASVTVLPRLLSDHSPILLKVGSPNFGPKPFKVFDKWLKVDEFHNLVASSWNNAYTSRPPDTLLKNKLRSLRLDIKKWVVERSESDNRHRESLNMNLLGWDKKVEEGSIDYHDIAKREEWIMDILRLDRLRNEDLKQKCIHINGIWVDSPEDIKDAAFEHFASRFKEQIEVKAAVWDCAGTKAPGPDGFNFNFIKTFWDLIKIEFWNCIKHFEETGEIKKGCNPSFIVLIPKKADPISFSDFRPISLIGCVYKMAKLEDQPLLLFKVDFEKTFDYVNWNFLLDIMKQMGFGCKWRKWISSCLSSASISVLINRSPSKEFYMERGLRQGDPLSPFLFLIVTEALQVTILKACELGLFKGVCLANSGNNISLLQFADDALFFGEWTRLNASNLINILRCFELGSGLKVNLDKSKLYGVGVPTSEVTSVASSLGCAHGVLPFIYLGLPVGRKMRFCEG
ncbi:putative RNA-directed DNA polymerase, partial [Tanacetum coccineum]